jgi:hypothetical protein
MSATHLLPLAGKPNAFAGNGHAADADRTLKNSVPRLRLVRV